MAKQSPFFLTGANAKIKLDGKTVAFATDFSYTVTVDHATPQLLGMYEAANVEPMSYRVSGTMTIIRYAKNIKGFMEANSRSTPRGVSDKGNGIGAMGPTWGNAWSHRLNQFLHTGNVHKSLNPSQMKDAVKFDVELFQKSFSSDDPLQAFARLRECRITRLDGSLTKRGMAVERIAFQAIYLDQDSFEAAMSGLGQQFL